MMLPLPRRAIEVPAARSSRKVPLRLTSITRSNSSSLIFITGLRTLTPGVLTRTSMGSVANAAVTVLVSRTSTMSASAWRPADEIAAAVRSAAARSTSAQVTWAPNAARASALVLPMPLPAPTTSARRPSSRNSAG